MKSSIAAGAVVYAKDLARMSAFYEQVTGLPVTHFDAAYAVLESGAFQLVVHAIPAHIAASIKIADPPVRREDSAVKLVFLVPSIAKARALAPSLGGELNPPEREWQFGPYRVCDGHDTEGNVIQLREHAP
jgi:predicted enzyme related to lactoylglutathione lyase